MLIIGLAYDRNDMCLSFVIKILKYMETIRIKSVSVVATFVECTFLVFYGYTSFRIYFEILLRK